MSPWRNRLARLTVNQEVGSSNLPGDVGFLRYILFFMLVFGNELPLFCAMGNQHRYVADLGRCL